MMKTICIAGTASGVGKTAVAEMLLRSLEGWSAAKISVGHVATQHGRKVRETHGLKGKPFEIVTSPDLLNQPGSDTARFLAAGARRVIWVRTQRRAIGAAVRELLRRLRPRENILVEGNSFARAARPAVTILVAAAGRREMKASARAILRMVDIVLLKAERGDTAQVVARAVKRWKARAKMSDVFVVRSFRRGNANLLRCVLEQEKK
jgi:molybdopterin-guanine dinucleotide biosynthesis protein